jgi:signal transduction histidine kinase
VCCFDSSRSRESWPLAPTKPGPVSNARSIKRRLRSPKAGTLCRVCERRRPNAVKHAQARRVVVTIHYGPRQFRLTVRDDRKAIDAQTMHRLETAGHFGLPAMRERAAIVKGDPEIRNAIGIGTEIELRVSAAIAYGASTHNAWRWRLRR